MRGLESDVLRMIAVFGQSRKPSIEGQGMIGFRNAAGDIVQVEAPRLARVIDPKEMFK